MYSTAHHAVGRLLSFEPALADGIFPNGFFSGKLGFVVLLRGLLLVLGHGWTSVVIVRALFVILSLLTAGVVVGLARVLFPERRQESALLAAIVLTSPVMLYLGFKTLSEVPSLLAVMAACWAFAAALDRGPVATARAFTERPSGRGFTGRPPGLGAGLVLTVAALALATLTRITAVLGFVSFVAALPLLADRRYSIRRAWGWAAAVLLAHAVVLSGIYWWLGITPDRLRALAQSVTGRTQGIAVAAYAVVLTLQAWGALAAFGLRWPVPRAQRFALAWASLGAAPYLLSASYLEPRFFYLTVPAVALLVGDGLDRAAWMTPRRIRKAAGFVLLAAAAVVDRAVLVPLMPFELDERPYARSIAALEQTHPGGTLLVPWLSDFCYLELSQAAPVVLTFSRTYGTGKVFSTAEFAEWVGPSAYAGAPAALTAHPQPWKYVGWTYNPSVLRVQARLNQVGLLTAHTPEKMGLLNHLAASWIWTDRRFVLTRVPGTGPYQAFMLRRVFDETGRN